MNSVLIVSSLLIISESQFIFFRNNVKGSPPFRKPKLLVLALAVVLVFVLVSRPLALPVSPKRPTPRWYIVDVLREVKPARPASTIVVR